jgi:endonuclease/exonuclease/phosphatase family metal-dependent hydrolase
MIDHDRLSGAQRFIAQCRPDILVLNEALWCLPHEGRYVDYANLLGFPYAAGSLYDGHWGNVILTREKPASVSHFEIYNRSGIAVRMNCGLTFATYHPHPSRYPENKASDFAALLAQETRPLVLCGDFNAIDPADRPDSAALARGFRRFSKNPAADVARFVDGGEAVFRVLAEAGMRDAVPPDRRDITMPTDMLSVDKTSGMRLDHILVSDGVEVIDAEVVHHPDAEASSDHRPMLADIRLIAAENPVVTPLIGKAA